MKVRMRRVAVLGLLALAVAGVGAWTSNAIGAGGDPPTAVTRFTLELNGNVIASFAEIELRSAVAAPAVREVGGKIIVQPSGATSTTAPPTVTLERGLTTDLELSAWHELALTGAASARKDVSVAMYDNVGAAVARYDLENAWPVKLDLKGGTTELVTESVTIVAEHMQRVSP